MIFKNHNSGITKIMVIKLLEVIGTKIKMCKYNEFVSWYLYMKEGCLFVCLSGWYLQNGDVWRSVVCAIGKFLMCMVLKLRHLELCSKSCWLSSHFWLKIQLNRFWKLDGIFFHLLRSVAWARSPGINPLKLRYILILNTVSQHYISSLQGRAQN